MTKYEKNTEIFYQELNGPCRPDKLLEIAKKGIFLYEPLFRRNEKNIREHEYVVYISVLAKQYYMIYNERQYLAFITNINNVNNFNVYVELNRFDYCRLVIINDYFLGRLLQETNELLLLTVLESFDPNYLLRFFHKFEKVPETLYSLFNKKAKAIFFDFINFFYFGESGEWFGSREPTSMNQKWDQTYFEEMATIIGSSGYDIQMIEYLVEELERYHQRLPITTTTLFRVPLTFPLTTLQYYTQKIYQPNIMTFEHDQPYLKTFFNTVFTDTYFHRILSSSNTTRNNTSSSDLFFFCKKKNSPQLIRYGIDVGVNDGTYSIEHYEEYQFQQELSGISHQFDTMEISEMEMEEEDFFDLEEYTHLFGQKEKIDQLSNYFILLLLTKILKETLSVHYTKNKLILYCDYGCESDMRLYYENYTF
ncbi:hypothetical protein PIROE2DRAFT_17238 [Piromyces sp. E2]|nr:hypothetical protein PIROE2DRAFT_17238 [Piromyces sp. E2]|eukprot:OUM57698.1 hypothetical protein PIROE2DRAFT_17238 [Piromyces sp. E2]